MSWTKIISKPEGKLGSLSLGIMNKAHISLAKWGLSHYKFTGDENILDIGCGGGQNIKSMLKMTSGKVCGIDISKTSVDKSSHLNANEINKRCEISLADVKAIPYGDESFQFITAFDTIYFWDDPMRGLREILRILSPGGTFLSACSMSDPDGFRAKVSPGVNVYSPEELLKMFNDAGFTNCTIDVNKRLNLMVKGKK